jgi:hypothetical protein
MKRTLFAAATALCLTACGSGDEVAMENASVAEVASEMRSKSGAEFVKPGRWQQSATLVEMEAPGIPVQYAEQIKKQLGTTQTHETCLTPDQVKQPREDFFTGADKNCRYEHFKWGDGKVDMKLNCQHPNATQTMEMAGTYEPESYQMTMNVASRGKSPMESMNMKMRVDAKRVGECSAKQG